MLLLPIMSSVPGTPVIFISYSHKDEPEEPRDGEIRWLTEIQSFLSKPAAEKRLSFELWDRQRHQSRRRLGDETKAKLASCDVCVLLASRHSLASDFVIDIEVETIRQRQAKGDDIRIFPILLSPIDESLLPPSLQARQMRPGLEKALSGLSQHQRDVELTMIVRAISSALAARSAAMPASAGPVKIPDSVHTTGLPDTPYVNLVGRDAELTRLDEAWAEPDVNIISLVAEGGAGKSALVNEWLNRLRADNYRGAATVLGWSFYSQGTKERATSADGFLDWAVAKLDIKLETTSATQKAEKIAEALMRRRVLLVLDGVEPLQYGPGPRPGQLKDQGLRTLLRHFAAGPPALAHGLLVLTSRLAVADLGALSGQRRAGRRCRASVRCGRRRLVARQSPLGHRPRTAGSLARFRRPSVGIATARRSARRNPQRRRAPPRRDPSVPRRPGQPAPRPRPPRPRIL